MRALVLEGGGMRAAYTNGVLAAFEDASGPAHARGAVAPRLGAVYGTSAGGALGAWFSAGQARYALGTWAYARDARVLSYARWATGRGPLLDHDALFRIVYERERPLDVDAVRRAPHAVVVTLTELETGRAAYVDVRRGPVLDWLRATGRLPLWAGPPVSVEGSTYLDGGLADPIPLARALADGATDVVLVLNEEAKARGPEPGLAAWLVGRRFPALRALVERHHALHDAAVALAERPPAGVRIRVIRPRRALGVGRLTRDAERIGQAILEGERDGRAFLAANPDWLDGAASWGGAEPEQVGHG